MRAKLDQRAIWTDWDVSSIVTRIVSLTFGKACFPSVHSLALIAQLVERFHGKEEVTGSIPVEGSSAPLAHLVRATVL